MNGISCALETVPEPEGRKTDEITSRIPLFCYYCNEIIEKKFSQQNKVLGNIEKFA